MRSRGECRHSGRRSRTVAVLAALAASLVAAGECRADGLVAANYQLNWDQSVTRTDAETKSTWTFKQTLDVKYRGFLAPVVQNEITMTVSEDLKSEGEPRNVIRVNPTITLGYKGSYWSAGAKRTIDDSNEPGKNAKISDTYFVELYYKPPRETLPDLKAKYDLSMDREAGTTDTVKHAFVASSVYKPNGWLELRGDYAKNLNMDRLKPDSDTRDDKYSGEVGIRHLISRKMKVSTQFKMENATGGTLLTAGGTTNDKHDQTYDWKNTLTYLPFRDTSLDASYDWNGKMNIQTAEHNFTSNYRVSLSQSNIGVVDVKGDFTRAVTETRHTADENERIDDTWTVEGRAKLTKLFNLNVRYQRKATTEEHFQDPTLNKTSGSNARSASLNGTPMPFWAGSVSYDKTENIENELTKTIDTKYGLKSTFSFKAVNVILEPAYDITMKDDRGPTPALKTETRDFKFKISWKFLTTANIDGKMDHTYGRKKDTSAMNIQRTDSSTLNIAWNRPFPNWVFGIDLARSATDTSEDDLPPDITTTYGFKADYAYDRLTFGTSYKYDRKNLADETASFDAKAGWTAPQWSVTVTYNFTKTYSATLNEGYTLGIGFKYNL